MDLGSSQNVRQAPAGIAGAVVTGTEAGAGIPGQPGANAAQNNLLVNGEKVIGFDLQDEAGNFEALNVKEYPIKEYERLAKGRLSNLKLANALDLSRKDMLLAD